MMTMSVIFLVHTITFLLLLQSTLHLADERQVQEQGLGHGHGHGLEVVAKLGESESGNGNGNIRSASMSTSGRGSVSVSVSISPSLSMTENYSNLTTVVRGVGIGMDSRHHFGLSMITASTRPTSGIILRGHRHVPNVMTSNSELNNFETSYTPSFHHLPSALTPSSSAQFQSQSTSLSSSSFSSSSLSSSSPSHSSSSTRMSRRAIKTSNNNDPKGGRENPNQSQSPSQNQNQNQNQDEPLEPLYLPSSTRIVGPYFESNRTKVTVTARAGQMVLFDCPVVLLQGRTVSWLRRVNDNLQLLTVGNTTYGTQSRVGLHFRYPNNWRLGILNVNKRDEGIYECQLSTHPPKALVFHLKVIAPAVFILDENGNAITERHYKVDSSLHLTCKANHLDKLLDHIGWFKGERSLPGSDSRIKVKLWKNSTNGEASAFLSVLSVRKGDSGNYTCRASPLASNTIAVHVLNGELPAAVQHENSANVLLGPCFLHSACYYAVAAILLLLISPGHGSTCLLHMPNSASSPIQQTP